MRRLLTFIDEFLLHHLQRLADRIHDYTGWDSLVSSRMASAIAVVFWVADIAVDSFHHHHMEWWAIACMAYRLRYAVMGNAEDELIRKQSLNGLRNLRRIERALVRTIYLGITGVGIPILMIGKFWLFTVVAILAFVSDYLGCCDVQTPKTGKIQEWVRGLLHQPVLVPVRGEE